MLTALGERLHGRGRFGDALSVFRYVSMAAPDDAEAVNDLGVALFTAGQLTGALRCLRMAIELRPDYADALQNIELVMGAMRKDEPLVPEPVYDSRAVIAELQALAYRLYDEGDPAMAASVFLALADAEPAEAAHFNDIGAAVAALNAPHDALQFMGHAHALSPDDATIKYNMGSLMLATSRPHDATEFLSGSDAPDACHALNVALRDLGRCAEIKPHGALSPKRYRTPHLTPSFMIIGAQKGGTTSLYNYLSKHPLIAASATKEIHFFDDDAVLLNGYEWYHRMFPLASEAPKGAVTFDSTPAYIYYPHCASRIHQYNPQMKLILILRDPVKRAYSGWNMFRNFKDSKMFVHLTEMRDFKTAVQDEIELMQNPQLARKNIEMSYVRRGFYAIALDEYYKYFSQDSLLITEHDELNTDPVGVLDKIVEFLGLPPTTWDEAMFKRYNVGRYEDNEAAKDVFATLGALYAPHNERLYAMLGRRFRWM